MNTANKQWMDDSVRPRFTSFTTSFEEIRYVANWNPKWSVLELKRTATLTATAIGTETTNADRNGDGDGKQYFDGCRKWQLLPKQVPDILEYPQPSGSIAVYSVSTSRRTLPVNELHHPPFASTATEIISIIFQLIHGQIERFGWETHCGSSFALLLLFGELFELGLCHSGISFSSHIPPYIA